MAVGRCELVRTARRAATDATRRGWRPSPHERRRTGDPRARATGSRRAAGSRHVPGRQDVPARGGEHRHLRVPRGGARGEPAALDLRPALVPGLRAHAGHRPVVPGDGAAPALTGGIQARGRARRDAPADPGSAEPEPRARPLRLQLGRPRDRLRDAGVGARGSRGAARLHRGASPSAARSSATSGRSRSTCRPATARRAAIRSWSCTTARTSCASPGCRRYWTT